MLVVFGPFEELVRARGGAVPGDADRHRSGRARGHRGGGLSAEVRGLLGGQPRPGGPVG